MSTDEIRSLVAATRAVAKAERERDEARATVKRIEKALDHWCGLNRIGYYDEAQDAAWAIFCDARDDKGRP